MMRSLVLLALLAAGRVANANETCDWFPLERVDHAFPDYAPWETTSGGGAGMCAFASKAHPSNRFSLLQTIESSDAAAEESMRSGRSNMQEQSIAVQAEPVLGAQGYSYGVSEPDSNFLSVFGQHKRMLVNASLTTTERITPTQHSAATKLVETALGAADDERRIAAAGKCTYFDDTLIRRLLPASDFHVDVIGNGGCSALAGGLLVQLTIAQDSDTARLQMALHNQVDKDCVSQPLAQLGAGATLAYDCPGGNPGASVRFVAGERLFNFTLLPSRAPTADERRLLVELAQRAAKH